MPATIRIPGPKEADIERTCTDFLALDNWRSFKMEQNFSEKKQKTVGESGMADHMYLRYLYGYESEALCTCEMKEDCACAQVMFIEWKRSLPSYAT